MQKPPNMTADMSQSMPSMDGGHHNGTHGGGGNLVQHVVQNMSWNPCMMCGNPNMTCMPCGPNMTWTPCMPCGGGHHDMTGGHNMTGGSHTGAHDMGAQGAGAHATGAHSSGHIMSMFFHTGASEHVLFEEIYTRSDSAIIGACLVVFVVAVLYEGLKSEREVLWQKSLAAEKKLSYTMKELDSGAGDDAQSCSQFCTRMMNGSHFLQAFLHIVQTFISYCLMLVFMTFNAWLCLAVVLGAGFGYLLFGWRRRLVSDPNEHCH